MVACRSCALNGPSGFGGRRECHGGQVDRSCDQPESARANVLELKLVVSASDALLS
jgi:hypothetical protein